MTCTHLVPTPIGIVFRKASWGWRHLRRKLRRSLHWMKRSKVTQM